MRFKLDHFSGLIACFFRSFLTFGLYISHPTTAQVPDVTSDAELPPNQ